MTAEQIVTDLADLLGDLSPEDLEAVVASLSEDEVEALLAMSEEAPLVKPVNPLGQARVLDPMYRSRDHLVYLAERLRLAVEKVEQGISQFLVVSMPPRAGKSQLSSVYLPIWLLNLHPDWPIGLISHDPGLAVKWGRDVRNMIEERAELLGVKLSKDSGAAAEWETTEKGGVLSRSVGQSVTGRGFKVLIVDDAVKDFADAHSAAKREALWNWWIANAQTRQNGPWLVVFIGTRWHDDDLLGRIQNPEFEGDPERWEVIKFPALAREDDVLGRKPGDPLISPLMEETREEAIARWEGVKKSVGTYNWNALYQQDPISSKGDIFDVDWWRYWTTNPANVSTDADGNPDGRVILIDPDVDLAAAQWMDSWDMAFKATSGSDYVVGQRWARIGARKFLIFQHRARMSYTVTRAKVKAWRTPDSGAAPYSHRVWKTVIEDKANGTAVIDDLNESISGLVPRNPTESKVARARSVTADCEAGNVFLPYTGDPGNDWVPDLISELREFPNGAHDDQVDALTQYLREARVPLRGSTTNPNNVTRMPTRSRAQVALQQQVQRRYGAGLRG